MVFARKNTLVPDRKQNLPYESTVFLETTQTIWKIEKYESREIILKTANPPTNPKIRKYLWNFHDTQTQHTSYNYSSCI